MPKKFEVNGIKYNSSGSDGLPAECYKVFWNDVHQYLLNALNCAYAKVLLAITQNRRRGLITLLPKKNKPADFLKNWRPITLLNCDYKVATKSIASRMRKVLPRIINCDQLKLAFQKTNRFIGENIRLLDSIINYTNTEQIPVLLPSLSTSRKPMIVRVEFYREDSKISRLWTILDWVDKIILH